MSAQPFSRADRNRTRRCLLPRCKSGRMWRFEWKPMRRVLTVTPEIMRASYSDGDAYEDVP